MSRASERLWAAWFAGLLLLVPAGGCGQGAAATNAVAPVGNRPGPAPAAAQPAPLTSEAATTLQASDEPAPVSPTSPAESTSPAPDVKTTATAPETLVDVDTESLEILRMLRDTWQGKSRHGAGDRDTRTASNSP